MMSIPKVTPIWFAALLTLSCAARTAKDAAQVTPEQQPVVIWSDPVEGLAIGIEQRGPVAWQRGEVSVDATIRVHLRNEGTDDLIWSDSFGVWTLRFQGPEFEPPKPFTDPKPPPWIGEPRKLGPGEGSVVEMPIVQAFMLWPPVPAGEYVIAASYDPGALRTFASGEERPFDVPGFWANMISTPEIMVRVDDTLPEGH